MPDLPAFSRIPVTQSLHGPFVQQSIPAWLQQATPQRRSALREHSAPTPEWYRQANAAQRKALGDSVVASFTAQTRLDHALAGLQDIDTFAARLLTQALKAQFNLGPDVNTTYLRLKKPIEMGILGIDIGSFEVLRLPLLQAALHNFEAAEAEAGAFHASSGFLAETAPGEFAGANLALTVPQFTTLCRTLDIGAKYQAYLADFLQTKGSVADQALQEKFSQAQQTALRAAAELALLQKDIRPGDYRMLLAVIGGDMHPSIDAKPVWFRDLGLMKHRMTGCIIFSISEQYRYSDDLILYIPNEPNHPLKRYTYTQMQAWFKQRFTTRAASDADEGSPTAYQRFFSRFVAYSDRPDYFSQLTAPAPVTSVGNALAPYLPLANELLKDVNPFSAVTGIRELPPVTPAPRVANPDPFLNPVGLTRKGHGIWAANINLWEYLYTQHRDKLFADARSHAVPTADVDARVRSEKLAHLLNIGLLLLNTVSMFVPVLGEVMMGVMAAQLLEETFAGVVEWSEGDRRKAKAHLVDVAENLAFLAVMAGVGKGLGRLAAVKAEPLIEGLDPVTLPDGRTRLWKPDLSGYESPVILPVDAAPTALGQYLHEGKTYIRQAGTLYETTFDSALKRWRIKHPGDPHAYQPPLSHNGAGAWRHTLERPQAWDRLTLMRRLGPVSERFSDEQLLRIADISGIGDDVLRQVHADNLPPPAPLAEALRLFKADADVAQVIEQVSSGRSVDGRYLFTLPLVTDLPRWPVGRVLQVFDGPGLTGRSQRYGVERLYHGVARKPAIQVNRADVLSSQLPAQILAALEEPEVVALLGGEAARVRENRPVELRKQLADHARSRQSALFDSLYKGTEPRDPTLARLQRLFPGLSEEGARSVIAEADAENLLRLRETGRVPLAMQEHARWQVQQGRVVHAYTGLHINNHFSADSRHLALHTLSQLPGWPEQLRLEVREGDIHGALLDSIGSPTAAQRKYVVKRGPQYQAFNERGETLNSLAPHTDNFYDSLMHALPDAARRDLGFPHTGQSLQLRSAIIEHAQAHPVESAQIVTGQARRQAWFKPPQRGGKNGLGYLASGHGEGSAASLVSRVQDVYPQLTDVQAHQFIIDQILEGRSDQQIFSLLQNRLREWQTLESTLNSWVMTPPTDALVRQYPQLDARPAMAHALKACWRNAPLAELEGRASLTLIGDTALPLLHADLSHVRTLTLRGRALLEGQVEALLGYFPKVQTLSLGGADTALHSVPAALEHMPDLKDLSIQTTAALEEPQLARLESLSSLENLQLQVGLQSSRVIDFSRLTALRSLRLSGTGQRVFPVQVLALPNLQFLDLKGAAIDALPPALFEPGRERLWSGLSLPWARLGREHFKQAYAFVRSHPQHLMDQDEMVREYCLGQLNSGFGQPRLNDAATSARLNAQFMTRWPGSEARFEAIEALSTEYGEVSARLDTWLRPNGLQPDAYSKVQVGAALRQCWYQGLMQRYGISQPSVLNLPEMRVRDLPELPQGSFGHVTKLNVPNAKVPGASLARFIRGFNGLRSLDASACGLSELSLLEGQWPALEHLDLSRNSLQTLDVSSLTQLRALNLRGTQLQAWPVGAEQLPQLAWLDLRDTRISQLPASALAEDRLVLDTHLRGAPLDPQAQANLAAAQRRVEQHRGLPAGALTRFGDEPIPDTFPPEESASSIARHLLPVSDAQPALSALTERLNDWIFTRQFHINQHEIVTSRNRQMAAQRILDCWRERSVDTDGNLGNELSFHGLALGELPTLPTDFPHVHRLNVSGAHITEHGSNGFLGAFAQVRTLVLSHNPLQTPPQALGAMARLERLELSAVSIEDPEAWYPVLESFEHLQWLDMSRCDLISLRIDGMPRLQTLDLSHNELTFWPRGVLDATELRTLDLSNNPIEQIPPGALEGDHDALMAGVDLSNNFNLPPDDLERLQAFSRRTGGRGALGISDVNLQQLINDAEHPDISDSDDEDGVPDLAPAQPDEVLGQAVTSDMDRWEWLANFSPEEQASKRALWGQLEAEPDNGAFFNLLRLLPESGDYQAVRASLTRRVWKVMEAAAADTELRETLFAMSASQGTCADGRILTFSGLETKVFEFETLHGIDPTDLTRKGAALLKLSRQLFRVEQVEKIAARHIHRGRDAAEVRLKYLIGLQKTLDLPAIPETMKYDDPIKGAPMEAVARTVLAAERSDGFYEDLISREYWEAYLKEKYPQRFNDLEQRAGEQREQLESAHQAFDDAYAQALTLLDIELSTERNQLLLELSRLETAESMAPGSPQPGTSRDLMGTPRR